MSDPDCPECGGSGVVADSIDNYVYDPWGLAPCQSCAKQESPPESPASSQSDSTTQSDSLPASPTAAPSPFQQALEDAVWTRNAREVERCLVAGAEPDAMTQRPISTTFEDWHTAPLLVLAARLGDADIVALLLAHGARASARAWVMRPSSMFDPYGDDTEEASDDALEVATRAKHDDVVRVLVAHTRRSK